jgi:hypothetical protein
MEDFLMGDLIGFRGVAGVVLSASGMRAAQRVDYDAACRRAITWRAHFERWGR